MSQDLVTREQLLAHIQAHGQVEGKVIQELDLRQDGELLRSVSVAGAAFLGCQLDGETVVSLYQGGAELFPPLDAALPFRPYRSGLYTVEELYEGFDPAVEGSFWTAACDSKIYDYYTELRGLDGPVPIMESLAMRLHDHAVEDALHDLLHHHGPEPGADKKVVAIMGGHAMKRDEPIYADIARMTRSLTRSGYFVATGGGPGAMEAGNLGAYFAPHADEALDEALALLAGEVDYKAHRYLQLAVEARERWPRPEDGGQSLAIPTWFYGHEPSNMFASHIAKYFANSVREDGLLAIAKHGVIFAPGSAGTIQEVFMDACQNHYKTFEVVSPMIMFGVEHWTTKLPVWPLLQAMSKDRPWAKLLALCDTGDEVLGTFERLLP